MGSSCLYSTGLTISGMERADSMVFGVGAIGAQALTIASCPFFWVREMRPMYMDSLVPDSSTC